MEENIDPMVAGKVNLIRGLDNVSIAEGITISLRKLGEVCGPEWAQLVDTDSPTPSGYLCSIYFLWFFHCGAITRRV